MKYLAILVFALLPLLLPAQSRALIINKHKLNNPAAHIYKINRIDSTQAVYLIYATKNDSLFKIASDKIKRFGCAPIRIGHSYALKLNKGIECMGCNISHWNGIPLDEESGRNLYEVYNLIGLCIK